MYISDPFCDLLLAESIRADLIGIVLGVIFSSRAKVDQQIL